MTDQPAPDEKPALQPLRAAVAVDQADPSGLPVVILQLTSGSAMATYRIDARQAGPFIASIAENVMKAAAAAMAAAGPQLLTPPAAGGLLIPGNGALSQLSQAERRRNGLG